MSEPNALTPEHIDALVVTEHYTEYAGTAAVVCCLVLANGHAAVGHSPTGSRAVARRRAREHVWELAAFADRQARFVGVLDVDLGAVTAESPAA